MKVSPLSAPMSHFGGALEAIIKEHNLSQQSVAEHMGVSQSQVSKYINEGSAPEPNTIERICREFPSEAERILTAYLRDVIPASMQKSVDIKVHGNLLNLTKTGKLAIADILKRLPPKCRRPIEDAARECEQNPEIINIIKAAVRLSRGSQS